MCHWPLGMQGRESVSVALCDYIEQSGKCQRWAWLHCCRESGNRNQRVMHVAGIWLLYGFFLLSFSILSPPFYPLTQERNRIESKGKRSLNKARGQKVGDIIVGFLPADRAIKFLGASLIFDVREYHLVSPPPPLPRPPLPRPPSFLLCAQLLKT